MDGATWTDTSGDLWLFGGSAYDASDSPGFINDLWVFNPATNEWTWMGGSNSGGQSGIYGTLGTPVAGNTPGGRNWPSTWTNSSGLLRLFGGYGPDSTGSWGQENDLWEYLPSPAATPAFSVTPGPYTSAQSVKISDATVGSTIFYTLDGSTPTSNSIQYKSALSVTATTTVKAIAEAAGYADSAVATGTYTILKPQTVVFTPPASPVTYGVKPMALSATASSGLAVTFSIVSGPAKVSGSTLTIEGAGTLVVAANQAGNATYAAAAQATHTITVEKAVLTTIAANKSMTYGGAVPKLSYTIAGFVNGDLQVHAVSGAPVLSTAATSKSSAGSYPISIETGTLEAKNYNFKFVPGALTINKARLTVKAGNLSMKQGAAVPALTYSMTGFLNGDTQSTSTTGQPALSTTANSKSTPGTYPITIKAGTLAAGNYSFSTVNGTLTVTK
jgi:hypothetical protein